jgi:hypothetical protein
MKPFYYLLFSLSLIALLFFLLADLLVISNLYNAEAIVEATNWMPLNAPNSSGCNGDSACILRYIERLGSYLETSDPGSYPSLYRRENIDLLLQCLFWTLISVLVLLFARGKLKSL